MAFFGKKPKPQGFHFTPRYYDPEKEDREARIKAAMQAAGGDTEAMKNRISASFRSPRKHQSSVYKSARRRSNITVLIAMIVLLLLALLLIGEFLPQIEQMLE